MLYDRNSYRSFNMCIQYIHMLVYSNVWVAVFLSLFTLKPPLTLYTLTHTRKGLCAYGGKPHRLENRIVFSRRFFFYAH